LTAEKKSNCGIYQRRQLSAAALALRDKEGAAGNRSSKTGAVCDTCFGILVAGPHPAPWLLLLLLLLLTRRRQTVNNLMRSAEFVVSTDRVADIETAWKNSAKESVEINSSV